MHIDRRRAPRVEVLGRILGEIVSMDVPVQVREVSLGGLSFGSTISFTAGAVHEFRLTLGDDSDVLLRGRIVRSQERIEANGSRLFITAVQFIDDESRDDDSPVGGLIDKIK
jgi:PilZ domain